MIKAVLFDYGGVLSEGGKAGAIRQIFANAYNLDPETLRFEDIGLEALKGTVSDDEFLAEMNARHPEGARVTKQDFLATVDHLAACQPVYKLAEQLRNHGIRTAILSNTVRWTAVSLQARGLYDGFDPLILSCNEGMAKPEPAIYKLALTRLGLPAHEVLFIDDQTQFLEPARAIGMQIILAQSPEQIVEDTKKLLEMQNGLTLGDA